MDDRTVRAALQRHWDASDASDFKVEHEIYREDAVLDYPPIRRADPRPAQHSREPIRPAKQEALYGPANYRQRRSLGHEFVLAYDGIPSYAVSIMEFREGLVANETQYFADRFDPATLARASCRASRRIRHYKCATDENNPDRR